MRDRREYRWSLVERRARAGNGRQHRDVRCWPGRARWVELEGQRGRTRRRGGRHLPAVERNLPTQDLRRRSHGERTRFAGRAVAMWRQLGAASQALGHGGIKGRMEWGRKKRAARLSARNRSIPSRRKPTNEVPPTRCQTPRYRPACPLGTDRSPPVGSPPTRCLPSEVPSEVPDTSLPALRSPGPVTRPSRGGSTGLIEVSDTSDVRSSGRESDPEDPRHSTA